MCEPFEDAVLPSLAAYDLAPPVATFALSQGGVNNHSVGIRTGAGDLVAKTYTSYDDLASIHYEHELLAWLAAAGLSFALPVPLPTRDARLLCRGRDGWMSLTRRLPGACPEFRLRDGRRDPRVPAHAELLGAATGELQVALQRYPTAPRPGRTLFGTLFHFPPPDRDPFTLTPERLGLPDAPPYAGLLRWWREEAARLQAFVEGAYRTLPWQVCHNDVSPANVLIDGGRVSAVLDFEFATPAARALDVAMGLRMTMQVWENPEPWEAARRFCGGYARWTRMTEAEVQALPRLLRLRTAIPFLWWLGRSGARGDPLGVATRIENLQRLVRWLAEHEQRLMDIVMREAG